MQYLEIQMCECVRCVWGLLRGWCLQIWSALKWMERYKPVFGGVLFPKIAPALKEHSAQDYLHIPYRNCALRGKSFTYGKSRTHGSDKQNYVLCNKDVRAQNIPKCRFFKKTCHVLRWRLTIPGPPSRREVIVSSVRVIGHQVLRCFEDHAFF